jgi:hypothetical protein
LLYTYTHSMNVTGAVGRREGVGLGGRVSGAS